MKRTLFVALLACVTLMFASCNKEKDLNGTNWKTHTVVNQEMSMEGVTATINMTIDGTMSFTNATNGAMILTTSGTMQAMGMTIPMDAETDTIDFTYTFTGENGTITMKEDNESISVPFTYNKKDNTINITQTQTDEETGLSMTIDMTFTEAK